MAVSRPSRYPGTSALLYLVSQALLYAAEVAVVHYRRLWPRALDTSRPTPADFRALGSLATEQKRLAAERIEVEFNADSSTQESAVGSPARVSTNGELRDWSAPDGFGLLRLDASSIQTDPPERYLQVSRTASAMADRGWPARRGSFGPAQLDHKGALSWLGKVPGR
jgi:hypothetical protein